MEIKKLTEVRQRNKAFEASLRSGVAYPLNHCQDIFRKAVGTPDSFSVLAYLYRRFGAPTIGNNADPDILFEYDFLVDGFFVSIHGVVGDSVYFRAYIPGNAAGAYLNGYFKFCNSLIGRLHAKGLPYVAGGHLPEMCVPANLVNKNAALWMKASAGILSEDEHGTISSLRSKLASGENLSPSEWESVFALTLKANKTINEKLIAPEITGDERDRYYPMFGPRAFPDVAAVAEAFCKELLTSLHVRDQFINVNGLCCDPNPADNDRHF